jgi:hypothetical protein
MSRSFKAKRHGEWWNHESTSTKRFCRRNYRAKVRQAIREGRFDLMPIRKGTQGWITW